MFNKKVATAAVTSIVFLYGVSALMRLFNMQRGAHPPDTHQHRARWVELPGGDSRAVFDSYSIVISPQWSLEQEADSENQYITIHDDHSVVKICASSISAVSTSAQIRQYLLANSKAFAPSAARFTWTSLQGMPCLWCSRETAIGDPQLLPGVSKRVGAKEKITVVTWVLAWPGHFMYVVDDYPSAKMAEADRIKELLARLQIFGPGDRGGH